MASKIEADRKHSNTKIEGKLDDKPIGIPDEGEFEKDEGNEAFVLSTGLSTEEAQRLLAIHGRNELPEKVIPKWYIFVSQLWQPMPVMIWLAAAVEAGIENW